MLDGTSRFYMRYLGVGRGNGRLGFSLFIKLGYLGWEREVVIF